MTFFISTKLCFSQTKKPPEYLIQTPMLQNILILIALFRNRKTLRKKTHQIAECRVSSLKSINCPTRAGCCTTVMLLVCRVLQYVNCFWSSSLLRLLHVDLSDSMLFNTAARVSQALTKPSDRPKQSQRPSHTYL